MLEIRRDLDLGQKALGAENDAQLGFEDLDGDTAVVFDVAGEIHGGHAPGADLALDDIPVGERAREPRDRVYGLRTAGNRLVGHWAGGVPGWPYIPRGR